MMSRKKKVLVLLHLCMAFTYLCWLLLEPYVKEIVTYKSQLALYEMVWERQALFDKLPIEDQRIILTGYTEALQRTSPTFWKTFGHHFLIDTPPFALAWLFFSLAISLLLLFHIEGAAPAAWLLPCVVLGYAYFLYAVPQESNSSLFPKEKYVLDTFVSKEEQETHNRREGLLLGWHRYLVQEWAHETPDPEAEVFQEQLDKGLFAFNVARLKWTLEGKGDEVVAAGFTTPPSFLRIVGYLFWNVLFAWILNRKEKVSASAAPSAVSY